MTKQQQYVAVVSLDGRVLHAVGPFPTEAQAAREGRVVAQGVELFRPAGEDGDGVDLRVLPLVADLGAMVSRIPG